jgi:hypothetical protein
VLVENQWDTAWLAEAAVGEADAPGFYVLRRSALVSMRGHGFYSQKSMTAAYHPGWLEKNSSKEKFMFFNLLSRYYCYL